MQHQITDAFHEIGARVKFSVALTPTRWARDWSGLATTFAIDIGRDVEGEFFDLTHPRDAFIRVLDVRTGDAHLLLQTTHSQSEVTSEFLCGHDERCWFAAAIPEASAAKTVQDAKDALKPEAVWDSIRDHGVPMDQRDLRRTAGFIRQGEWFFIPRPTARIHPGQVLRNEPIRRGRGKPHTCQFLYRYGGEDVFVSEDHPNGLTMKQFRNWPKADRARQSWERLRRGAAVLVRGAIMHPDHDTIFLKDWHEVVMNRESEAAAMQQVAFFD